MYCPQCGQQQASAEMRFCSRCGFPLAQVAELVAGGGVRPRDSQWQQHQQEMSPRRKGVSQGVMMLMMGAIVVPILGILSSYNSSRAVELLVGLSAVIFFIGGLVRILYAAFFEQGAPSSKKADPADYVPAPAPPAQFAPGARPAALPPPQSAPVPSFAPRHANTAELATPPSVTENTTKLLDEERARPGER